MITIKLLSSKRQFAAMKRLHKECFPDGSPVWAHDEKGCAFGLYEKGEMIAYAQGSPSPYYPHTVYLARVGVAELHRGHGMQKFLTSIVEDWARRNGLTRCVTDTANFSIASMRSLMAGGYKPFWPDYPWALTHSLYWSKQL
jgi:GNAT superfamily N-acetyltransferase